MFRPICVCSSVCNSNQWQTTCIAMSILTQFANDNSIYFQIWFSKCSVHTAAQKSPARILLSRLPLISPVNHSDSDQTKDIHKSGNYYYSRHSASSSVKSLKLLSLCGERAFESYTDHTSMQLQWKKETESETLTWHTPHISVFVRNHTWKCHTRHARVQRRVFLSHWITWQTASWPVQFTHSRGLQSRENIQVWVWW